MFITQLNATFAQMSSRAFGATRAGISRHARTSRAIRLTCSSRRTLAPRPAYRWWLDFIVGRSRAGGTYLEVS